MWREIGIWILILIVILIFSQVWFHLVEGLLSKIKAFLNRNKKQQVWHTFEETDDDKRP